MRLIREAAVGLLYLILVVPVSAEQQPVTVELEGVYVHELSGFVFPETIAGYRRLKLTKYNADGTDIGVGYQWTNGRTGVTMTVFVYGIPELDGAPVALDPHFDAEKRAVRDYHRGTLDVATANVVLERDEGKVEGRRAEFIVPSSSEGFQIRSSSILYLFHYDRWTVKYRASFPEGSDEARSAVQSFVNAFSWRGETRPERD